MTKVYDNISREDCLRSLLEQVPLERRLLTMRPVSSQWQAAVEDLCRRQKMLTLRISWEHSWAEIAGRIKCANLLVTGVVSPFHSLTVNCLTEELTTFLTSVFPRLQTLAVVVIKNNPKISLEAIENTLHCLPRLIAAYTDTLTTLQIVFDIPKNGYSYTFYPLMDSIDGLHQLKRLSFYQITSYYITSRVFDMQPFVFPRLLRTSLETLDFHLISLADDLPFYWVDSLQERTNPNPMQINYTARARWSMSNCWESDDSYRPKMYTFPVEAAVHFHSLSVVADGSEAFTEFFTNSAAHFTNLKSLWLTFESDGHKKIHWALSEMAAKLSHLTELTLMNFAQVLTLDKNPLPLLPAVQRLRLIFFDCCLDSDFHESTKNYIFTKVFPGVKQIRIDLPEVHNCDLCKYRLCRDYTKNDGNYLLIEPSQVEQCVTLIATSFASKSSMVKPEMLAVNFRSTLAYRVHFSDSEDGGDRLMKLTKVDEDVKCWFLKKFY